MMETPLEKQNRERREAAAAQRRVTPADVAWNGQEEWATPEQRKKLEKQFRKAQKARKAEAKRLLEESIRLDDAAANPAKVASVAREIRTSPVVARERIQQASRELFDKSVAITSPRPEKRAATVKVTGEARTYGKDSPNDYVKDRVLTVLDALSWIPTERGNADGARERLARYEQELRYDAQHDPAIHRHVKGAIQTRLTSEGFQGERLKTVAEADFNAFVYGLESRDVSTGATSLGDFVPPYYDLERSVPYRTSASPLLAAVDHVPLPPNGMLIDIPTLGQPITVREQSAENTVPAAGNPTASFTASAAVGTFATEILTSQQAIERSGIKLTDLYMQQFQIESATQIGTELAAAIVSGAQVITNSNSPGTAELWADATKASSLISTTAGVALPATHLFTTSPIFKYYQSLTDSQGRPIFTPEATGGQETADFGTGYTLAGLTAAEDNNISNSGSNGYVLVGVPKLAARVYDSTPAIYVWPQGIGATQLTVSVVIQQYATWAVLLPSGWCAISGSAYPSAPTWTNA